MNGIPKIRYGQIAGLKRFWFTDRANLVKVPLDLDGLIEDDIQTIPGSNFYRGYDNAQNLSLGIDPQKSAAGTVYRIVVRGFVTGDDYSTRYAIEQLQGRRLMLIVQDREDRYRLLTGGSRGLLFQANFTVESQYTGRKGYEVTMTGFDLQVPPYYTGAFQVDDEEVRIQTKSISVNMSVNKTSGYLYEPFRFELDLEAAPGEEVIYFWIHKYQGATITQFRAGYDPGTFTSITDPKLRSGQAIRRYFAATGQHDMTCIAANLNRDTSGAVQRQNIVTIATKTFTGIGGRQPDAWFDASIYTTGTLTNNLGFLTGQSAVANQAPVFNFNNFEHIYYSDFGALVPVVNITGDFAFACKIVFPSQYSSGNRYARLKPMSFSNRQDGPTNKVMGTVYTHQTGAQRNVDYVLYAYRVGGILNAYINDEQVLNNVVNNSTAIINFGLNENYALAELIHYNKTLSQAESDGLRNYMWQKYSVGPYA